jgi:hypothetical protein
MKLRGSELWDFATWASAQAPDSWIHNESQQDRIYRLIQYNEQGILDSGLIRQFRNWRKGLTSNNGNICSQSNASRARDGA